MMSLFMGRFHSVFALFSDVIALSESLVIIIIIIITQL